MNISASTGTRLPVPASVRGTHFLYKASSVDLDCNAVAELVATTNLFLEDLGLNPGQIELLGKRHFLEHSTVAGAAFDTLVAQLGWSEAPKGVSLLVCEWSAPHVDTSFSGSAFVSVVLHTGFNPYVLQALHTTSAVNTNEGLALVTTTRRLSPNDVFVMDPTTPHWAMPLHPGDDQLFIVLQIEVPDTCVFDRALLLQRFPPMDGDLDDLEVFNGY